MYDSLRLRGFTLIELLVVIAIIAVLAAILFPVFARAREKSYQTSCLNNQRQIATSINIYTQDNDETMPNSATVWTVIALPRTALVCPTKGEAIGNGYGYNVLVAAKAIGTLDVVNTTLTADCSPNSKAPNLLSNSSEAELRHDGKTIVSYVDGHVTLAGCGAGIGDLPIKTGLLGWYRADMGCSPTLWSDQSGNGNDLAGVAGALPLYLANTINGMPSLHFMPNISKPLRNASTPLNLTNGTDATIYIVYRYISSVGFVAKLGASGTRGYELQLQNYTSNGGVIGSEISFRCDTGTSGDQEWWYGGSTNSVPMTSALGHVVSGTTVTQYVDMSTSAQISSTFATTTPPTTGIWVGGQADGGGGPSSGNATTLDEFVGEAIFYNRALSASEEQQVGMYLGQQYGIIKL